MTWIDIRDPKENEKAPPSYEELSDNYGLLLQKYNTIEDGFAMISQENLVKNMDIDREMEEKETLVGKINAACDSLTQIQNNSLLTTQDIKSILVGIDNDLKDDGSIDEKEK